MKAGSVHALSIHRTACGPGSFFTSLLSFGPYVNTAHFLFGFSFGPYVNTAQLPVWVSFGSYPNTAHSTVFLFPSSTVEIDQAARFHDLPLIFRHFLNIEINLLRLPVFDNVGADV